LSEDAPKTSSARAPRARAFGAGLPTPETCEPSPEMVAAGVAVLWQSGVVEGQLDSDEDLVLEIYQAMRALEVPPRGRA